VYSPILAGKIWAVIVSTPNCQHWLPSRSHKDPAIFYHLERIARLRNAVVRYSSDSRSKAVETVAYIAHGNKVSPKKFEKALVV